MRSHGNYYASVVSVEWNAAIHCILKTRCEKYKNGNYNYFSTSSQSKVSVSSRYSRPESRFLSHICLYVICSIAFMIHESIRFDSIRFECILYVWNLFYCMFAVKLFRWHLICRRLAYAHFMSINGNSVDCGTIYWNRFLYWYCDKKQTNYIIIITMKPIHKTLTNAKTINWKRNFPIESAKIEWFQIGIWPFQIDWLHRISVIFSIFRL